MLDSLTHERFAGCLNQRFEVELQGGETLATQLVSVTPLSRGGGPGRREPFSMILRGPATPSLPQRIYPVMHESVGRLEIFLVPVGPDREGMCYEAIFT